VPEEEEFDEGRGWVAVRQAPKKKPKPPADPKLGAPEAAAAGNKDVAKKLADNESQLVDLESQLV